MNGRTYSLNRIYKFEDVYFLMNVQAKSWIRLQIKSTVDSVRLANWKTQKGRKMRGRCAIFSMTVRDQSSTR